MRRVSRILLAALGALLAGPASALGASDCASPLPAVKAALAGQGSLESVIGAPDGRLYYTDSTKDALMRLDRPGAAPHVVSGISSPGGLAFDADPRYLFVGQGDAIPVGLLAPLSPGAAVLRVDLQTGVAKPFASGVSMANGIARDARGNLYASDDVSLGIDRITPDGKVQRGWSSVLSGNGMAIDAVQRYLYVNQTFVPAAIQRVDLASGAAETFVQGEPADIDVGLDGMDIDRFDRLVSAANSGGQVWRIGTDRKVCVLARGLTTPSAVGYGRGPAGSGFPAGHLYVVTFGGLVAEVPAGYVAPPQPAAPKAKKKKHHKKKKHPRKRRHKHS